MRRLLERFPGRRRSRLARRARAAVAGRRGLEIGGPSRIFSRKGRIPIYPFVAGLDGCDFQVATTWRPGRQPEEGYCFAKDRPAGRLVLCEATDLAPLSSESYDVVLGSHILEHVANPLRALAEWRRVTRPGGTLLLVVPHREGTFDHRRPVTSFEHLVEDLERDVGEDDLTHLPEVLALHDIALAPGASTHEDLERRGRANVENRCLHHHVFDTELAIRVLDHAGWDVGAVDVMRPFHIALLAERCVDGSPDNRPFLEAGAAWRRASPFPGDRG